MGLVFSWPGALGLAASLLVLALAGLVLWARPGRRQNQRLSLMLGLIGIDILGGLGMMYLTDVQAHAWAWQSMTFVFGLAAPFAYLLFLATLDTPIVRPLTHPVVDRMLKVGLVLGPVAWFAAPGLFIEGITTAVYTPLDSVVAPGFWIKAIAEISVSVFGLVASISVWRRSKEGTPERSQARIYAWAFGIRDVGWSFNWLLFTLALGSAPVWLVLAAAFVLPSAIILGFAGLLAYGILKHQLFDIDLRIKRGIQRGTVVGALAGAYLVTSLGIDQATQGTNGPVAGAIVTALLLLGLTRLQGLGAKVADAAMPHVQDVPAYIEARKVEVYRASLAEARATGGAAGPDTPHLARLRRRLGLTARDHAILAHALDQGRPHPPEALLPGEVVADRFEVISELGRGGQGTTFLAEDRDRGQHVAIKEMPVTSEEVDTLAERARQLQTVDHPNLLAILEVLPGAGRVLLVLEHAPGGSLADLLTDGRPSPEARARLARDLLSGLSALHTAGIVHRDVKPSNILVAEDGRFQLADFGVARIAGLDATAAGFRDWENPVGTIRYMSPEQARGQNVDHRSDLYSAAAVIYEAAAGTPLVEPRQAESPIEVQMRVASGHGLETQPPELGALTPWLQTALSRAPEDRFQTAEQMLETLPEPRV